ncbi:MAG TPA: sialate O-acetylesterase [Chitinispirillaceae bacterium]|nr:sialate O-acetylesterase [Chitinispirillaceae bacterium]
MFIFKRVLFFSLVAALPASHIFAAADPDFHIYLLFGQSNMAGGAAGQYDGEGTRGVDDYCDTTPRVQVLAWGDCNRTPYPCPNRALKRTFDQWYTAFPPYHNCHEGIGPADAFAKTLLDSIRSDIKIGFVPCALSGQKLDVFMKGKNAPIDEHTQPANGSKKITSGGYEWMVKRCKIAQEKGVIKGILFHQGEADNGRTGWPADVKSIVDNLKKDLGLWDSIPFIAGELRYDGCCASHNTLVNKLPGLIPNCAVASANGLERRLSRPDGQVDQYHFSTKGTKDFGKRYAIEFLKIAKNQWIPRINSVKIVSPHTVTHQKVASSTEGVVSVYSLDGHRINTFNKITPENAIHTIKTKGVYIVSIKLANSETVSVPFVKN